MEFINEDGDNSYVEVLEVHYNKLGKPVLWGESNNLLISEDKEDLNWKYDEIETAFKKPILRIRNSKFIK